MTHEQTPFNHNIQANPACTPEILAQQVAVDVEYMDFDGNEQFGTIEVHADLALDVHDFFEKARKESFPIAMIAPASDYNWDDNVLMAANVASGFNYRPVAGSNTLSLHSLGRAFDINPVQNPYIRYLADGQKISAPAGALHDKDQPGTLTADHPLVQFMKDRGWEWGGDWSPETDKVRDYQHFEKALTS